MNYNELTNIISGYTPGDVTPDENEDLLTKKLNKLQQAKDKKKAKLVPDTLVGMHDGDSLITANYGDTRSADGLDTVEVPHGDHGYDMQGYSNIASAKPYQKSGYSMRMQRELVAKEVGKPIDEITEQDMIDVGNRQTIQRLADIVREDSKDSRWEAPLIHNSGKLNLTGTYTDEYGRPVNAPLNIPIAVNKVDQYGERPAIETFNPAGENTTVMAAKDARLNASTRPGSMVERPVDTSWSLDRLINLRNGVQSSIDTTLLSTVDTASEFAGKTIADTMRLAGNDTIDGIADTIDSKSDLASSEDIRKFSSKIEEYDDKYSKANMEHIHKITSAAQSKTLQEKDRGWVDKGLDALADITKNVPALNQVTGGVAEVNRILSLMTADEIGDVVLTAVNNPETFAESSADMVMMLVGKGSGMTKLGRIKKAKTKEIMDTPGLSKAEKKAKIKNITKEASLKGDIKLHNKLADMTANNLGVLTVSANMVNKGMDEFEKENNRPMTYTERLGSMVFMTALNKLDALVMKGELGNSSELIKTIKDAIKSVPESTANKLLKNVGAGTAKLVLDGVKEFGQETTQEGGEASLKYDSIGDNGEVKNADKIKETAIDGIDGGFAGTGMGVQTSAVGATYRSAKASKDYIAEKFTKQATKDKEAVVEGGETSDVKATEIPKEDIEIAVKNAKGHVEDVYKSKGESITELKDAVEAVRSADTILLHSAAEEDSDEKVKAHEVRTSMLKTVAAKVSKSLDDNAKATTIDEAVDTVYGSIYAMKLDRGTTTELLAEVITDDLYITMGSDSSNESPKGTEKQNKTLTPDEINDMIARFEDTTYDTDVDLEESASNEDTVSKPVSKEKSEATSQAKPAQEPTDSEEVKDTNTHTAEHKVKTVMRLAKKFGIEPKALQATLNSTFQLMKIKKMVDVSKDANKVQYDTYYGKKGIVPTFVKYRKAIADGDEEVANEAIKVLQEKGLEVTHRKGRYEAAYLSVKSLMTSQIKAILNNKKISTEEKITRIKNRLASDRLKPVEVDGSGSKDKEGKVVRSKRKVTPKELLPDVLNELGADEDVLSGLGVSKEDRSEISHLIEAMDETVGHLAQAVNSTGNELAKDKGKIVTLAEDKARYEKKIAELEANKVKVEKELGKANKALEEATNAGSDEDTIAELSEEVYALEDSLTAIDKGLANNTEGIDRIKTDIASGKTHRWSTDRDTDAVETAVKSKKKMGVPVGTSDADEKVVKKVKEAKKKDEKVVKKVKTSTGAHKKTDTPVEEVVEVKEKASNKGAAKVVEKIKKIPSKVDRLKEAVAKRLNKLTTDKAELKGTLGEGLGRVIDQIEDLTKLVSKLDKMLKEDNVKAKLLATRINELESRLLQETEMMLVNNDTKWRKNPKGMVWMTVSRLKDVVNKILKVVTAGKAVFTDKVALAKAKKELEELNKSIEANKTYAEDARKEKSRLIDIAKKTDGDATVDTKLTRLATLNKRISKMKEVRSSTVKALYTKRDMLVDQVKGDSRVREIITSVSDKLVKDPDVVVLEADDLKYRESILGKLTVNQLTDLLDGDLQAEWLSMVDRSKKLPISMDFIGKTVTMDDGTSFNAGDDNPGAQLYFNEKGELNELMAIATIMTVDSWVADSAISTKVRTKDDVANLLGKSDGSQVTASEYTMLKDKGSLRKLEINSLARQVFGIVGISAGAIGNERYEKLLASVGGVVVATMEQEGVIEDVTKSVIPVGVWKKLAEDDESIAVPSVDTPMVKAKGSMPNLIKQSKIKRSTAKGIQEALVIDEYRADYVTKPPKSKTAEQRGVRGSHTSIPEESADTLNIVESVEFVLQPESISKMEEVYGTGEEGRSAYLKNAGWKDIEEMKESGEYMQVDIDSQEAKNIEIENGIDNFNELAESVTSGKVKSMWFKWFFSKNGRFMLDSIGINPQTNKVLHRWLITAKDNIREFDLSNKKDLVEFAMGVTQAFGFATDKKLTSKREALYSAIVAMEADELVKAVREGVLVVDGVEYSIDHPGHAIQALVALDAMRAGNGKFTAAMVAEYDAVTSGFANKILQIPLIKGMREWMAKTGMFKVKDMNEGFTAMNNIMDGEREFDDAYQTLARKVQDILKLFGKERKMVKTYKEFTQALVEGETVALDVLDVWDELTASGVLPKLVDEEGKVTGEGRNLFKYPFMIFNYASGMNSITKSLAEDIIMDIFRKLLKYDYSSGDYDGLLKKLGVNNEIKFEQFKQELRDAKDPTKFKFGGVDVYRGLHRVVGDTYGSSVGDVMTETFEVLVEANKHLMDATKLMFRLYKVEFDKRVEAAGKDLTKEELDNITKELTLLFPLIKAPNSESRYDGAPIVSSALEDASTKKLGPAKIRYKKNGVTASMIAAGMSRQLEEAQSAGAVLPIHWIDGTIIGKALIESGLLGVHDAIVAGKDSLKHIQNMNKATYEVGRDYNLMEEMTAALAESIVAAGEETVNSIIGVNVIGEDGKSEVEHPLDTLNRLVEFTKDNNTRREELYKDDLLVANIIGMEDSHYVGSATKLEISDIITSDDSVIVKNITRIIKKELDKCKG